MAEISAKQVQALRAKTDLAMMDCKKALVEAGGDEAKAMEILRKKFADKMSDRGDKETANGRIGVFADETCVGLSEVRCETDFVATNDTFRGLADTVARQCAKLGETDVDKLKASKLESGQTITELLTDCFGKLKENMAVQRAKRLEGPGACYVHHNGKVGAAIVCDKTPGDAGRNICMHIASTQVILGAVREDVDPALFAEAKEKALAEVEGKPDNIKEKIVEGKMNKWYGERVLVEQAFVMDDKKTVAEYAKENGFAVKGFIKYEVGGKD